MFKPLPFVTLDPIIIVVVTLKLDNPYGDEIFCINITTWRHCVQNLLVRLLVILFINDKCQ